MVLWAVTYCLRLSGLKVPRRHRIVSSAFGSFEVPHLVTPAQLRITSWQSPLSKPYHSCFRAKYTLNRRVRKVFYYHVLGFASTFLTFFALFQAICQVLVFFELRRLENVLTIAESADSFNRFAVFCYLFDIVFAECRKA